MQSHHPRRACGLGVEVHVPQLDISLLGEVAVTRCYFKKHRIILSENFIYWLVQRNLI